MEVKKVQTVTTLDVFYEATGAPLLLKKYTKAHQYQPDKLTVRFVDGEAQRVTLAGPRILKSGLAGDRLDESFSVNKWARKDIPAWVKPYLVLDK